MFSKAILTHCKYGVRMTRTILSRSSHHYTPPPVWSTSSTSSIRSTDPSSNASHLTSFYQLHSEFLEFQLAQKHMAIQIETLRKKIEALDRRLPPNV